MRNKYRSAVYSFSKLQSGLVGRELSLLQREFDKPLITKVLPLVDFKSSDERFHNYYLTDPDRPFCKTYIDPKLAKLRRDFGNFLSE